MSLIIEEILERRDIILEQASKLSPYYGKQYIKNQLLKTAKNHGVKQIFFPGLNYGSSDNHHSIILFDLKNEPTPDSFDKMRKAILSLGADVKIISLAYNLREISVCLPVSHKKTSLKEAEIYSYYKKLVNGKCTADIEIDIKNFKDPTYRKAIDIMVYLYGYKTPSS